MAFAWLGRNMRNAMLSVSKSRPVQSFSAAAQQRPFLSSGLSAGATLGLTDMWMQSMTVDDHIAWDTRRTVSMASWGLLWYGGPQQLLWTRVYPAIIGEGTALQAVGKAFVDCLCNVPFVYLPCFYALTGTIKGFSLKESMDLCKREWFQAAFGMAAFWVPVQCANFYFLRVHLQTYVVSAANVVNKSWLSWLSNRERVREQQAAQAQELFDASTMPAKRSLASVVPAWPDTDMHRLVEVNVQFLDAASS